MAETISITICGDGGCGKSSITLRLVRSQWSHDYDPTIEDSYSVTRTVDGLPYFLSLTDTAGQEEYRGLWAASNLNSDAFLLVYDITNESSLETLDHFMEMIDMETETREEKNRHLLKQYYKHTPENGVDDQPAIGMPAPVKIIAGNKCDLKEARVVSSRQGLEWARRRGCGFMETSAWEMVNIEETFALIVRRVVKARKQHYEQQVAQLHALRQTNFPTSPRFFPPLYKRAGEPIAHSQTAPLTIEERQDPPEHSPGPDAQSPRKSLWLTMVNALSIRDWGKSPKQSRTPPPPELRRWGARSRPETLPAQSGKKSQHDINGSPAYRDINEKAPSPIPPRYATIHHKAFGGAELVSLPWWKRLLVYPCR